MRLDVSPDTVVERLPAGERQLVEIAKALSHDARLIIFDEPTTSLSARETEALFARMGRLHERGIAHTRAMNLPDSYLQLGAARIGGMPLPPVFGLVAGVAHGVPQRTAFGRQIYAVGNNRENARKAGIATERVLFAVYVISGLRAAIGAILTLGQLGSVSPKFGETYEFKAIAAACSEARVFSEGGRGVAGNRVGRGVDPVRGQRARDAECRVSEVVSPNR